MSKKTQLKRKTLLNKKKLRNGAYSVLCVTSLIIRGKKDDERCDYKKVTRCTYVTIMRERRNYRSRIMVISVQHC